MDVVTTRWLRRTATIALVVATVLFAVPSRPDPVERWAPLLSEASARFNVPVPLLRAVMRAESGGLDVIDGRPTTSAAGAMGLMQIMPTTWAELKQQHRLGNDPYAPRDNVLAGAAYLAAMRVRYGERLGVAAYHAGPARVDAHLRRTVPLPSSTLEYLATVFEHDGSWTRTRHGDVQSSGSLTARLFVVRSGTSSVGEQGANSARHDALFVTLSTRRRQHSYSPEVRP